MIAIIAIYDTGRIERNRAENKKREQIENRNYVPMPAPLVHEMTWTHLVVTKRASANIRLCRLHHHHAIRLHHHSDKQQNQIANALERRADEKPKPLMTKQNLYPLDA